MCNRYRFTEKIDALAGVLRSVNAGKSKLTPRNNVAPTQLAPVVTADEKESATLEMMRWGLVPSWSRDGKGGFLNARSETLADKPAFRGAYRNRRCLVIAHGFYEWQTAPHGKQPWHFHLKGDQLMCFAGLWEQWRPPGVMGEMLHTFTIITTSANPLIAPLHDRMPVILPPEAWTAWLNPRGTLDQLKPLLIPFDETGMEGWTVSPRMNNARYESPDCADQVSIDDRELRLE